MKKTQDASIIPNIWIVVFFVFMLQPALVTSLEGKGKKLTSPTTDHLHASCENTALQVFTQTLLNAFRHKLSDSNPSSQHLDITKCCWQDRVGVIQ